MDNIDREAMFKRNNPHLYNKGNNNVQVNGDNNQVANTINNYNNTTVKNTNKFTPDYNIHISSQQAHTIQSLISDIVDKEVIGGMSRAKAFAKWHKQLRNYMNVNSYLAIHKEEYNNAIEYLRKQNLLKRSKTRRKDNNYWRNDIYKSIYTRTNQLNISKQELYKIVHARYGNHINSITELGERNLDDLRKYIYNLKA